LAVCVLNDSLLFTRSLSRLIFFVFLSAKLDTILTPSSFFVGHTVSELQGVKTSPFLHFLLTFIQKIA